MEPNVDRGMWSVVALLAAIVIGGVVLLAFPKISGKIANSMDKTVNQAFSGEVPGWVENQEVNKIESIIKFIDEMEKYKVKKSFRTYRHEKYLEVDKIHAENIWNYTVDEWGVSNATRFSYDLGKAKTDDKRKIINIINGVSSRVEYGQEYVLVGVVKNEGESEFYVKHHAPEKRELVKPGETKFINIKGKSPYQEGATGYFQTHIEGDLANKRLDVKLYGMHYIHEDDFDQYYKSLEKYNLK